MRNYQFLHINSCEIVRIIIFEVRILNVINRMQRKMHNMQQMVLLGTFNEIGVGREIFCYHSYDYKL